MAYADIARWHQMWPSELAAEYADRRVEEFTQPPAGFYTDLKREIEAAEIIYVNNCYGLAYAPRGSFQSAEEFYEWVRGNVFETLHDMRSMMARTTEQEQWALGMRCPVCGRVKHNLIPSGCAGD
jgi:hypothetical protein